MRRLPFLLDGIEVRLLPIVPSVRIPPTRAVIRVTWTQRGILQVAELEVHPHVCRGPVCVECERLVVRRMDPEEAREKGRAPRVVEPPPRGVLRIGRRRDR